MKLAAAHPWPDTSETQRETSSDDNYFDKHRIGELFVCRNAGNIADFATIGTLEYGTEHLGVPLIVVMGHTKCGAITAACDAALNGNKFSGALAQLVDVVLPVAKDLCADGKVTTNVIRASASQTAKSIISGSKVVENLVSEGKVKVVSAIYDIDTGMVEFDA